MFSLPHNELVKIAKVVLKSVGKLTLRKLKTKSKPKGKEELFYITAIF